MSLHEQERRQTKSVIQSSNQSLRKNKIQKNNTKKIIESSSPEPKSYRSIHTNYQPFLNYIRDHEGIDETTVKRAHERFGSVESFTNHAMQSTTTSTISSGFNDQIPNAKTKAAIKAEQDDARHADLHANYKSSSYSDEDKIFLLKREIDNLKDQLKSGGTSPGSSSGYVSSSNVGSFSTGSLVSVLLLVGVLLVAARRLRNRLARIRSDDALLTSEELESAGSQLDRDYTYRGVELQEQSLGTSSATAPTASLAFV